MITIAIIFATYLLAMVVIGFVFYSKTSSMSDYALGGRKLNSWVTAMSAQASDMSGWLLTGLPGLAYVIYGGTTEALWTAIGLVLGTYLNWLFVAKRLRKYTELSGNSITIPDFLENRFRDRSHILRMVSALFIIVFFLVYTASGYSAGAKLFSTVFGMDYTVGLVAGAFIILLYSAVGGFSAVCWTDTIQGVIMFFALIAVPVTAVFQMGGLDEVALRLAELSEETFRVLPHTAGGGINLMLLSSALAWGLGYFGQPHILVRFMGISSPDMIRKSRIIAMVWVLITLTCAVSIGVVGKAFLPDLADGERIYMTMIDTMFSDVLSGILLIAILAAIMSTASSQLLVTASSVSQDIYALVFRKDKNSSHIVWVSRITVAAVTVAACLIALDPDSSVFGLVSCAWGGFGAAFGPLILFSLFWRRTTREGAAAGMIVGGVVDLFWYLMKGYGGIFAVYEIIPGFLASCAVIVAISLLTKVPSEVAAEFDAVR